MKTIAIVPMKLNNRRLPQKNSKRSIGGTLVDLPIFLDN